MSSPTDRIHALDNLRAAIMFMGITHHSALAFTVTPLRWMIQDRSTSFGFDAMVAAGEGFRMQMFFLLAGFFGRMLMGRMSLKGFLWQRGQRIGAPFALSLVTLVPVSNLIWSWGANAQRWAFPSTTSDWLGLFSTPGHLWFLEMLIILQAGAAVCVWTRYPAPSRSRCHRLDAAFDWLVAHPWRLWALLPATVLLMWPSPAPGQVLAKGASFWLPVHAVSYYGLFFVLGWWLHRRPGALERLSAGFKGHLSLSLLSFPAFGLALLMRPAPDDPWFIAFKVFTLLAASLFAWATVFAMTAWFMRHANCHRPLIRHLSNSSYWCYLVHLPLVLWLHGVTAPWNINCWMKFGFVVLVTTAASLLSYECCVRRTWLGWLLNGRKQAAAA
ncbi:MAG: acyltransferase family protein [Prosthecobacter sp.]|jgi:glucan biosynthesis protein C|uniref:acyltransferase family protein n=1 Tax=Prosthecobacter sp. TaxID=1965333 RepID=UPI0019F8F298|nr:acyltransferase family protein [Prosthecobacter sp.]MBE2282752.1 acyltransferase family protein [Prosthecobacter sp.]